MVFFNNFKVHLILVIKDILGKILDQFNMFNKLWPKYAISNFLI